MSLVLVHSCANIWSTKISNQLFFLDISLISHVPVKHWLYAHLDLRTLTCVIIDYLVNTYTPFLAVTKTWDGMEQIKLFISCVFLTLSWLLLVFRPFCSGGFQESSRPVTPILSYYVLYHVFYNLQYFWGKTCLQMKLSCCRKVNFIAFVLFRVRVFIIPFCCDYSVPLW